MKLSKELAIKQDKLKIACLENGGLPAIVDGDRFVCIKLSHKAQKEMNDLKKKLNLPEIADKVRC